MNMIKDLFGVGPLTIAIAVLIAIVSLMIEQAFNLVKIPLHPALSIILLVLGFIVLVFSVVSLPLDKRSKQLVTNGPYKYVRHPIYSAVIFLFYPAVALFLKSWLMLVSTFIVYLVFKIKSSMNKRMKILAAGSGILIRVAIMSLANLLLLPIFLQYVTLEWVIVSLPLIGLYNAIQGAISIFGGFIFYEALTLRFRHQ